MSPAVDVATLTERVDAQMPEVRRDLEALVAIPSINFAGYDRDPVRAAAEAAAGMLRGAGATDVRLLDAGAGTPAVVADVPGPAGAPTVLLYAHYDVQPPGDETQWLSPPYQATERDGRLYGRGAADDKSGCALHIATVRAFEGRPPVSLRVVLEGEEESGGAFEDWPSTRPEVFEDVAAALIADVGNLRIGEPTFATSMRGVVDLVVEVRTLRGPAHSGLFGGPAPDALMVLIRLLATLHDEAGDVAVDGIVSLPWDGAEYPEDLYRELGGVLDGVPLIGTGGMSERLFTKPALNVIGLDAPPVATAPNAVIPHARAKVSLRLPPGVEPHGAMAALRTHLETHAPWGVAVEVHEGRPAPGTAIRSDGPAYAAATRALETAYGRVVQYIGSGGAIPFVANLVAAFPAMEVLLFGAQDPSARIHAPNESVDLKELRDATLAQVLFVAELGAGG